MKYDYLQAHDERAVRTAVVSGLATLRKANPGQTSFAYVKVVHEVAKELLTYPAVNEAAKTWEAYQTGYETVGPGKEDEHPDNRKLLAAIWSLIGQGLVFPRLKSRTPDGQPHAIDVLVLTARGERIASGGDQHPLHPGFIARFKGRAPNVSDEIVARMEDAISCLESSLLRAAVVMVGLAVEETLRVTHAAMVNQGHISRSAGALMKAKHLLDDIEKAAQSWTTANDEQHRLKMAVVSAESIRTERNSASHPGVLVNDAASIEELVVLAGRQLPIFWEIPILQALNNGWSIP
jgi:hypothetical protein